MGSLALAAACGEDAENDPAPNQESPLPSPIEPHTGDLTKGRLVVADHASPTAWVFNLDPATPELLETISLTAPARAYASTHGRYAYLVQRDQNRVDILDSGVVFEFHVDHFHIAFNPPSLLSTTMTGLAPTHFNIHGGWVAVFYDGSGDVGVLDEATLSSGNPQVDTLQTGPAHHGAAVVAFGHVLATIGTEGEALPTEVGVWSSTSLGGEPEMRAGPCPGLHGEAASGAYVAFGCSDGVLLVASTGAGMEVIKIDNPSDTPEGTRVGTLHGHDGLPVFIGNWGRAGFSIIDPERRTITPVLTSEPVVTFALDTDADHVFALTADGRLHRFEASNGEAAGEPVSVSAAIDLTGGRGVARPALTSGAERMYLSLPGEGQVLEIRAGEFDVERTISTGGSPASIATVAVSPDWHEGDHDHDHDHGD